jgi:hypothetical protein
MNMDIHAKRASSFGRMIVFLAVAITGCASAKITQRSQTLPAEWTRPSQIVVFPFAVDPSEITLNQSVIQETYRSASGDNESAAQLEIARATADSVCQQIASSLNAKGYNSLCAKRGVAIAGDNVLIVVGEFSNISEGNRLRRLVVGLGSGSSTMDSGVSMYQRVAGNFHHLLSFKTHADSGKMPGAAIMAPVGVAAGSGAAAIVGMNVAAGGAKTYSSSTSSLAKKTSDQIVKTVTDYFVRAGWWVG